MNRIISHKVDGKTILKNPKGLNDFLPNNDFNLSMFITSVPFHYQESRIYLDEYPEQKDLRDNWLMSYYTD